VPEDATRGISVYVATDEERCAVDATYAGWIADPESSRPWEDVRAELWPDD
jgi:hypothetical protein